jgi:hypothetical protein
MDYLSEVLVPSENEHSKASLPKPIDLVVLQASLLENIGNLIDNTFDDDLDDELNWVYFGVGGPA